MYSVLFGVSFLTLQIKCWHGKIDPKRLGSQDMILKKILLFNLIFVFSCTVAKAHKNIVVNCQVLFFVEDNKKQSFFQNNNCLDTRPDKVQN